MIRHIFAACLALFTGAAIAQDAAPTADTAPVIEMTEGNPDATVEIIEYASFTCSHCAHFHEDQYQKLRENYIQTGKVKFVFREVYFDRAGLWASMMARCGGEMRFFGISEMLFEQQRDWLGDGDLAGIADRLRQIGKTAGMSDETLDACFTDADQAQALVDWFTVNVERDGIDATPTLLINGEKHSNMSYDELAAVIDQALAE